MDGKSGRRFREVGSGNEEEKEPPDWTTGTGRDGIFLKSQKRFVFVLSLEKEEKGNWKEQKDFYGNNCNNNNNNNSPRTTL